MSLDELKELYEVRKADIRQRLLEFEQMQNEDDKKIFSELCFCLLTPQSKAKACDRAIKNLESTNVLFTGNERQVRGFLDSVRFHENKSRYIVKAREMLNTISIKEKLKSFSDSFEARHWLIDTVKGLGYKEASHFLRNVGMGEDLAILDRHILKNLVNFGVIDEVPISLTSKRYLEIEQKMKEFSDKIEIPLAELDLLLWSKETGEIFK
ncbi:MAG: N-glycosylase/DNA lyase [Candidatus Aenigmarchaeota archaeon]|nr:N-glycosylase/DNA lyase [Candidatus Aenigmarchaeota archaeon]